MKLRTNMNSYAGHQATSIQTRSIKAAIVCMLLCSIVPLSAATPWLHTDGNKIKDPAGNVVVLRGVDTIDLGEIDRNCGGMINLIDRLTNRSDTQGSSPGWYPKVIRLAIYPADEGDFNSPWTFEPGSDDYYNNLLRPVVDYCKSKDLYAIIDWHYVGEDTWDKVAQTSEFWEYMAPRFANDSHVLFELFNEPKNKTVGNEKANWLSVRNDMQTWINIVRNYAPNNLILVAGANYSQIIGLAANYPLTGDNIVIVSHIYPGHWLSTGKPWYVRHIETCLTVYPVFMSEWGFSQAMGHKQLSGTITNYGQPLMDFCEGLKISSSAWVASNDWRPPIFNLDWTLRIGEGEMGGFLKDMLYLKRNDDQPSGGDTTPPAAPTGVVATAGDSTVSLDWGDNGESDLYGYDVYRSITSGGGYSRINLARSSSSNYIDNNVNSGATYYYVITAVDTSFNKSSDSSGVSTTPGDRAPPSAGDAQIRAKIKNRGSHTMINKERVESFLRSARNELEQNILRFWIKYCQDNEYGGFIGKMSNDRTIVKDAPKGLVLNARILWTFSAAYRFEKKDEYLEMAKRSFDYLMQYFWDKQFGGAYWLLDHSGKTMDDSKEMYGQSFLIYGLAEYYLATGDSAALEKAKELFYLIEKHCHDDANKGYFETFKRDWSITEKARLATGDAKEKKTMNTHLHLLEAYTNLYRVWKDEKLKSRLIELIEIFQKHIINSKTYHFDLFFDEKWNSTKNIESLGHDIEGSWLLCEAAEVLGDENIIKEVQATAMKMVNAVCDIGFDTDGSLFYEAEGGHITNAQKDWWPQAEAVVGLINAYQLSKEEHFFEGAERCWLFIREHIVDSEHGEWLWKATQSGKPDGGAWKISEWKAPYHNSRVCLEVIRRLQELGK